MAVTDEDGNNLDVAGVQYDQDREFFIINLSEQLSVGNTYTVEISYTAYLKDNLKGTCEIIVRHSLQHYDEQF